MSRAELMTVVEPDTVSIVLASHDRSRLIEVEVDCFHQQQSVDRLELIVVDDSLTPSPGGVRDTCDVVGVPRVRAKAY